MSKRIKYEVCINGVMFHARHDVTLAVKSLDDFQMWKFPTRVEDVYGRCSDAKKSAWNVWNEWVEEYRKDGTSISVTSHTCNFFTLAMLVCDAETGTWWYCVATGRNNYATRIIIK